MGEASHPGPEFRRLRRGSVRNVVPRARDRVVDVTDDEDDIPLSAVMTPVTSVFRANMDCFPRGTHCRTFRLVCTSDDLRRRVDGF